MNSSASAKKHVFISFSTDDRTYADKIINHLHKYNIPVWIDFKNLVPGTPDWDNAIKAAIHNSAVVLLLVSPNSIKSPFVKGEIAVALSRKVAVFPVWIHGASWEDCAPLHIIGTQYLDLRGNKLQQDIEQLDDLILPHLGRQKNKPQTKQKVKKQNQTDRKKRSKKIFLLIAIIICIVTALLFILFSPTQPKPVPSKRIEEIKEIEEFKKIQEIKETGSLKWTTVATVIPLVLGISVCFFVAQLWRLVAGG